jgi:dipeptidyl aminopeptidase/acylaminoacyl peptidase
VIAEEKEYTTYKYSMQMSPDFSKTMKKVSGIINIPTGTGPFPVIVMYRGFVSQEIYVMGMGTQPSAKVFASNGYITIAPDFLGYGESDQEAADIFESRLQTYVTAAVTLRSVNSISKWDENNIFIWGHSNGGQVAITTLEITGASYPTILWAPVSMRFPASVLYYIDEADDGGKFLISETAKFEETYDAEKFSLTNYLENIKAPIQINQGTYDTAVPYWLTDSFNKKLNEATVSATYIKYSGADHNMRPKWNEVVENNLIFFETNTK